jgi:hypothetical protein
MTYIPQKADKGEAAMITAVGAGGGNLNLSYAVTDAFGLAATGHINFDDSEKGTYAKRRLFECTGYFLPITTDDKRNVGILAGAGMGRYSSFNKNTFNGSLFGGNSQYVTATANYSHFYLAPFFTHTSSNNRFSISFAPKVTWVVYNNYQVAYAYEQNLPYSYYYEFPSSYSRMIFEPTFKWSIGGKYIRFVNQLTFPVTVYRSIEKMNNVELINDFASPSLQFGLVLRINTNEK